MLSSGEVSRQLCFDTEGLVADTTVVFLFLYTFLSVAFRSFLWNLWLSLDVCSSCHGDLGFVFCTIGTSKLILSPFLDIS